MTSRRTREHAFVVGGGTGGHVVPALAIAEALARRGHPRRSIRYVGSRRGLDRELVGGSGFPVTLLPGRGLARRVTAANLGAVAGLAQGLARAVVLVGRARPAVVVAVGGYASVACALAAVLWRVPVVVAEQNAVPGAANRLVARLARAAAVTFPATPLPRAVVTGNPVREQILAAARSGSRVRAREELGIGDRHLVLVTGGSLGALRLNEAVLDALPPWAGRRDLVVHHVVGSRDWPVLADRIGRAPEGACYRAVRYEDGMDRVLAAADLVVCRAGSGTLAEVAVVGVPALVVPSPNVTDDHQTANARHLERAGAAVVLPDDELTGPRLAAEVDALLGDPQRLAAMAEAARSFARPDAADLVAALAEEHAR